MLFSFGAVAQVDDAVVYEKPIHYILQLATDMDFTLVTLVKGDERTIVDSRFVYGNNIALKLSEGTEYTLELNGADSYTFYVNDGNLVTLTNKRIDVLATIIQ